MHPLSLERWLDAAAELAFELLQEPALDPAEGDAARVAVYAGGRLRLVLDFAPQGRPRLRVKVIERSGSWWLLDSTGRDAPAAHAGRIGPSEN